MQKYLKMGMFLFLYFTEFSIKINAMKNRLLPLFAATVLVLTSCTKNVAVDDEKKPMAVRDSAEMVEYGKYLVTITGCNDCHTPKKMGARGPELVMEQLLSGYQANRPVAQFNEEKAMQGFAQMNEDMTAAAGPWGISFAANLTPHESGIGNWTFEQFKKALTQGKAKGMDNGRMLLPPMPWFNYAEMKDDDVRAIYLYLQSVKPVDNTPPPPVAFAR